MDDLKFLYRTAGGTGKGVTFLFTDNEIKDEAFLEYMNNLLSSGEISNLFPRDEMDEILQELIGVMKKEFPRRTPTNENLFNYYMDRVKNNLHVALCFSPVCAMILCFFFFSKELLKHLYFKKCFHNLFISSEFLYFLLRYICTYC